MCLLTEMILGRLYEEDATSEYYFIMCVYLHVCQITISVVLEKMEEDKDKGDKIR